MQHVLPLAAAAPDIMASAIRYTLKEMQVGPRAACTVPRIFPTTQSAYSCTMLPLAYSCTMLPLTTPGVVVGAERHLGSRQGEGRAAAVRADRPTGLGETGNWSASAHNCPPNACTAAAVWTAGGRSLSPPPQNHSLT